MHGGRKGFDRAVWHAEPFERDGTAGVVLTHTSPDGDEGFPGALSVSVTYSFDARGELKIDYSATTDKATLVNLTNHSYFNLGGPDRARLGHRLTLNADHYTPVDKDMIPVGEIERVAGPRSISRGDGDRRSHRPTGPSPATGYDHNFVIDRADPSEVLAARVEDPKSGRVLEVFTTEPGVQLYTSNQLVGSKTARAGRVYGRIRRVCLETQHFPDSPNKLSFRPRRCGPARRSARARCTRSARTNQATVPKTRPPPTDGDGSSASRLQRQRRRVIGSIGDADFASTQGARS